MVSCRCVDLNSFMKIFKQRLIDCSKQDWCAKIVFSGKTRHYRFIMPALKVANYVYFDILLKFKISLSKLECSFHMSRDYVPFVTTKW